jgi:DNA polymerase III subunit delta'
MPLKDVKNQSKAIGYLKACFKEKRISHAYLFTGPSGVGKRFAAVEFVKLLNCHKRGLDNCNTCASCFKINKNIHPDVFLLSKGKDGKAVSIDDIRILSSRLMLKPYEAKYKAAIIDAKDMTEEASNSILKILEEPSPFSVFILIAADTHSLQNTLVSRCQLIRFKPLTRDEAACVLSEDFGIDKKQALLLAGISGCNIKKTLGLKDEDIVSWKNSVIDEFTGRNTARGDTDIAALSPRAMQKEVCDILISYFRDIIVFKYSGKENLVINADRVKDISQKAGGADISDLQAKIAYAEAAKKAIFVNANAKLTFNLLRLQLNS